MEDSLENVPGIGKATAERLKAAGIDSIQKLASIKPKDLLKLKIKGIGKATATKYVESANEIMKEIKTEKQEEMPSTEIKDKIEAKKKDDSKAKKQPQKISNIKNLIKQQAECNIGLVGHVDHGMIMSFRQIP